MKNKWLWARIYVLLVTFVGLFKTMAPTVSLWDCGEFIAAIYTQGIPHPPGTPFYMVIGKAWTLMLGFIGDVALRVNLLSVVSSVLCCLLAFEVTAIVAKRLNFRNHLALAASVFAATVLAFTDTFWFNAVEAEVYGLAMTQLMLGVWILLKWESEPLAENKDRWLLLFVFQAFLGIGIHMYSMLSFPVAVGFIAFHTNRLKFNRFFWTLAGYCAAILLLFIAVPALVRMNWVLALLAVPFVGLIVKGFFAGTYQDLRFWLVCLLLTSVIGLTKSFMVGATLVLLITAAAAWFYEGRNKATGLFLGLAVATALSLGYFLPWEADHKAPGTWFTVGMAVVLGVSVFKKGGHFWSEPAHYRKWSFLFLLVFVAGLGYSSHLYLPLRSATNPVIDQNNPETWESFRAALERRQYQAEGMLIRMFYRRASISNQFGISPHIGYLGYHLNQFWPTPKGANSPLEPYKILGEDHALRRLEQRQMLHHLFWLGVFVFTVSAFWVYAKRSSTSALILALFVVSAPGLVLYINFSDGSRIEERNLNHWNNMLQSFVDRHLPQEQATLELVDAHQIQQTMRRMRSVHSEQEQMDVYKSPQGQALRAWVRLANLARNLGYVLPEAPSAVHREVRDRDYFYTPAFMFFTLMLAFALFGLWNKKTEEGTGFFRGDSLALGLGCLFWLVPFITHYREHDRTYDFLARDFAYNLLSSVPPNGILFTNGDNDTFPLWYKQEVEKFRKDVLVVNFSLANSDWYISQFVNRGVLHLDTPMEDLLAKAFVAMPDSVVIPLDSGLQIVYPKGMRLRVQDLVLGEIMRSNYPERPIVFTLSTPEDAMLGLGGQMVSAGLIRYLSPHRGVDQESMDDLLLNVYQYTHLDNPKYRLPSSGRSIVASYRSLANYSLSYWKREVLRGNEDAKVLQRIAEYENLLKHLSIAL
jgi:macrodomain Ter protein organizer (MatP/YcbG family)